MPQSSRDIKRRITSVAKTAQITKAMEMVASAKLRRVQDAVQSSKPYLLRLQTMLAGVSKSASYVKHPLLNVRPVKKTGYLVITSDGGLKGPYNSNVIRRSLAEFRQRDKSEYVIYTVGRKGRDFFNRYGYPIGHSVTGVPDAPTYHSIGDLAELVIDAYANEAFDELYMVYNEFKNAVTQAPVVRKVLPLTDLKAAEDTKPVNYLYEPDAEAVLTALLPKYAETLVYQAVLDAKASEHAAQMTAMGNATDAANDMIKALTLALNRARQAAITTQIAEVVGGAEALK